MSKPEEAYGEATPVEVQKVHGILTHGAGTCQQQRTRERGTDTEEEARHGEVFGTRWNNQSLAKTDTGEHANKDSVATCNKVKGDVCSTSTERCKEEVGKESQPEEMLLMSYSEGARVGVPPRAFIIESAFNHVAPRNKDAAHDDVYDNAVDKALKSPNLSRGSEVKNTNVCATNRMSRAPRLKKPTVSPDRLRRPAGAAHNNFKDISALDTLVAVIRRDNKCLETRITATEQKVRKQRQQTALLVDQLRKTEVQKGHLEDELATTQIRSKHHLTRTQSMEEEGNVLRKKIQEREEALAIKICSAKDQLEGRIARSQRSLEQAEAAKQAALRDIRELERRFDAIATQATEERKRARDFEEKRSKIDEQLKKMEVRLYDAKLECSLENARRLDVKRQLDVAIECRDKLKRELAAVCNALGSPRSATGRSSRARNGIDDLSVDRLH